MPRTSRRPGIVLGTGVAAMAAAALTPAGVGGAPVPPWAWIVWAAVFALALLGFRRAGYLLPEALRRVSWLVPMILVFVLPAALFAPTGTRLTASAAVLCRAVAAASTGAAMALLLGPHGLAAGVRQLGAPARLADVFEAMLASIAVVLRQVRAMLRAREARRPAPGAWSAVIAMPVHTVRGFGRLVAALLLRALERAEALERARRARGGTA